MSSRRWTRWRARALRAFGGRRGTARRGSRRRGQAGKHARRRHEQAAGRVVVDVVEGVAAGGEERLGVAVEQCEHTAAVRASHGVDKRPPVPVRGEVEGKRFVAGPDAWRPRRPAGRSSSGPEPLERRQDEAQVCVRQRGEGASGLGGGTSRAVERQRGRPAEEPSARRADVEPPVAHPAELVAQWLLEASDQRQRARVAGSLGDQRGGQQSPRRPVRKSSSSFAGSSCAATRADESRPLHLELDPGERQRTRRALRCASTRRPSRSRAALPRPRPRP